MYKNEQICQINIKTGAVTIFNSKKIPYSLYLESTDNFDDRINNLMNFHHWCASRVLSLDREYAKEILNSCALSQGKTDKEKSETAWKYKCLSLQDSYWTKDEKEDCNWDSINLFHNSLSNSFVDVSLTGKNMSVTNTMLIAADCSTSGIFPKAWVRKEDGFWLYKGDKNDSVRKEVEASKILQKLGLNVLNYEYFRWNGEQVSACKCYTNENIGFVSIEEYEPNHPPLKRDVEYYTMILADYLVGNSDRHWGNWGYLVDNTGTLSFAPIMDFNHAFEAKSNNICKPELIYGEQKTELEAAYEALTYISYKKADLSEFHYGDFVISRIKELEQNIQQNKSLDNSDSFSYDR